MARKMTKYEREKFYNFFLALTDEQVEIAEQALEIRANKKSCYKNDFNKSLICRECPMAVDCAIATSNKRSERNV